MTVEQLLKPRYKVIADYPKSIHNIGTVINAGGQSEDLLYCDWDGPRCRDYPHLFKQMAWWEDRTPEEMPEYLKDESGEVWKVYEYSGRANSSHVMLYKNFHDPDIPYGSHSLYELLPATETEYNEYLKTLNP